MSGGNILQMLPSSDRGNLHESSCKLCGSVKDITHCKNLLRKVIARRGHFCVYGRFLPWNE